MAQVQGNADYLYVIPENIDMVKYHPTIDISQSIKKAKEFMAKLNSQKFTCNTEDKYEDDFKIPEPNNNDKDIEEDVLNKQVEDFMNSLKISPNDIDDAEELSEALKKTAKEQIDLRQNQKNVIAKEMKMMIKSGQLERDSEDALLQSLNGMLGAMNLNKDISFTATNINQWAQAKPPNRKDMVGDLMEQDDTKNEQIKDEQYRNQMRIYKENQKNLMQLLNQLLDSIYLLLYNPGCLESAVRLFAKSILFAPYFVKTLPGPLQPIIANNMKCCVMYAAAKSILKKKDNYKILDDNVKQIWEYWQEAKEVRHNNRGQQLKTFGYLINEKFRELRFPSQDYYDLKLFKFDNVEELLNFCILTYYCPMRNYGMSTKNFTGNALSSKKQLRFIHTVVTCKVLFEKLMVNSAIVIQSNLLMKNICREWQYCFKKFRDKGLPAIQTVFWGRWKFESEIRTAINVGYSTSQSQLGKFLTHCTKAILIPHIKIYGEKDPKQDHCFTCNDKDEITDDGIKELIDHFKNKLVLQQTTDLTAGSDTKNIEKIKHTLDNNKDLWINEADKHVHYDEKLQTLMADEIQKIQQHQREQREKKAKHLMDITSSEEDLQDFQINDRNKNNKKKKVHAKSGILIHQQILL